MNAFLICVVLMGIGDVGSGQPRAIQEIQLPESGPDRDIHPSLIPPALGQGNSFIPQTNTGDNRNQDSAIGEMDPLEELRRVLKENLALIEENAKLSDEKGKLMEIISELMESHEKKLASVRLRSLLWTIGSLIVGVLIGALPFLRRMKVWM